jgi:hypothetical protein
MPPPDNALLHAVANRALLEQATGVLMWRLRLGPDDAAAVLQRWADEAGVDVSTVCDSLVNVVSVPDHPRARDLQLLRRLQANLRGYGNDD